MYAISVSRYLINIQRNTYRHNASTTFFFFLYLMFQLFTLQIYALVMYGRASAGVSNLVFYRKMYLVIQFYMFILCVNFCCCCSENEFGTIDYINHSVAFLIILQLSSSVAHPCIHAYIRNLREEILKNMKIQIIFSIT